MGTSKEKAFKVIRIPIGHRTYIFLVKLGILLAAVVAGGALLWYFGRPEGKELLGILGVSKFIEITGEALEEAIGDNL